jgi:glycosyltransferase involved in cell wall biosynthesis
MPRLSLVIPCYNEARNLPALLKRCGVLTAGRPDVEVVLVDNGSTDESAAIFREILPDYPGCRVVRVEQNRGYGFGILSGLRAGQGDILAWTHADLQTDPADALQGLEFFEKCPTPDGLYVKGKRYGRPVSDTVFTVGMSIFETLLLGRRLWDINAQPTMFSRRFFESWASPPHDFALDLYAYYNARRGGLTVKRFAVKFGERLHGQSHWNVNWAAKWKFIRRTVNFSMTLRMGADR